MKADPRAPRRARRAAERIPQFLEHWGRGPFFATCAVLIAGALGATLGLGWSPWLSLPVAAFVLLGLRDALQTHHSILRNFPLVGHARYFFESVRPELRQYFVESDQEQNPFSREMRSVIYQRGKGVNDTRPFGTLRDVYADGYDWVAQSLEPHHPAPSTARVLVGERRASQPYSSSIFNVSAMSYGALSDNAIRALNQAARDGGFSHNTGEGGVSSHHLEPGGDLVWQVGTGYFGCRNADGGFDPERFREMAADDRIKMIELKLSQGAKPAHGGVLPGAKVTLEIAQIRGVPIGQTVLSPPMHSAFRGPTGLLEFVTRLREMSGGKPVGFKLCVGQPVELMAIVKAMHESGLGPDFITVDGAEGGTGAAPLEFSNSVGMPLCDGLSLVHNALVGAGLRRDVKIFSAGKIATGFHVLQQLALGADACNSARGMMFALGCIQALKCNTNKCPVGVATQDPRLTKGLVVEEKAQRIASYHHKTIASVLELVGAAGLDDPADLLPRHIYRRVSPAEVRHLGQIYLSLEPGSLLDGSAPDALSSLWHAASATRFGTA